MTSLTLMSYDPFGYRGNGTACCEGVPIMCAVEGGRAGGNLGRHAVIPKEASAADAASGARPTPTIAGTPTKITLFIAKGRISGLSLS
jgi:hypothetical protein